MLENFLEGLIGPDGSEVPHIILPLDHRSFQTSQTNLQRGRASALSLPDVMRVCCPPWLMTLSFAKHMNISALEL